MVVVVVLPDPFRGMGARALAPHCEWRTLPGLGSDHLPIEIVLPLSPVRHPNTRPPKFNYKKASWDIYQSYIAEHLPSLDLAMCRRVLRKDSLRLISTGSSSLPVLVPQPNERLAKRTQKSGSALLRSHRRRVIGSCEQTS